MTQSPKGFKSTFAIANAYLKRHPGRYLFPIRAGAKFKPLLNDNLERNCSNDPKQITKWSKKYLGCNWGLALRKSGIMAIDVDTNAAKNKQGQITYDALALMYDWPETETTTSPSGGKHYIYEGWTDENHPAHIFALGTNGIGLDIDVPNYVLIPGCIITDAGTYTSDDAPAVACPAWIYETIAASKGKNRKPRREGVNADPLPAELIKQALDVTPYTGGPQGLDDRRGQQGWLNFMMAVHEASGGDPEAMGYLITWSEADREYNGDNSNIQARWESLDSDEAEGITRASWFKLLASFPGNDDLLSRMTGGDAADEFPDDGAASEPVPDVTPSGTDSEFGTICKEYVYFGKQERFFNLTDWELWKTTSFDKYFAGVSVMGKETKTTPLSMHIFRNRSLPMFRSISFEPGNTRKNVNGGRFNMWVPSDIVPKQGDTAIFDAHMKYLFPDDLNRKHVLNYMAWVYRNQGKKPRHALLVHGEETGTGKSFLAAVMRRLLGKKLPTGIYSNTTRIKGTTLDAAHGGWEYKTKLLIVEEVRPGF